MGSGHTLLVLRHAKAGGEPGVNDLQRELTGRGRRNAKAVGQWLLARGILPDLVLCSTARRTVQTWERVSAALGAAAPDADAVWFEPRVYDAGGQDLLDLVSEQPDDARTLLIVGHNPACQQLAAWLTARPGLAFPTCALAVIRLGGSWAAAAPGGGELAELWAPGAPALPPPAAGPGLRLRGQGRPGRPPHPWTPRAGRARYPGTARSLRRRRHPGRLAWR